MATVIFDFDSTLVACESLEEVLRDKNLDASVMDQIHQITAAGMSNKISFLLSLEKRLGIIDVEKNDFLRFGDMAYEFLTPGMEPLIADLMAQGVDVWIISGAMQECLLSLGKRLGIAADHILGVHLLWSAEGRFIGFDNTKAMHRSKVEGAKAMASRWTTPKIVIGDAMTDYALFEHGLVEHFILFTQHARRQAVVDKSCKEAKDVSELRQHISEILNG